MTTLPNVVRNLRERARSWGNRRRRLEGLAPLDRSGSTIFADRIPAGRIANPRQQRKRLGLSGSRSGNVRR